MLIWERSWGFVWGERRTVASLNHPPVWAETTSSLSFISQLLLTCYPFNVSVNAAACVACGWCQLRTMRNVGFMCWFCKVDLFYVLVLFLSKCLGFAQIPKKKKKKEMPAPSPECWRLMFLQTMVTFRFCPTYEPCWYFYSMCHITSHYIYMSFLSCHEEEGMVVESQEGEKAGRPVTPV